MSFVSSNGAIKIVLCLIQPSTSQNSGILWWWNKVPCMLLLKSWKFICHSLLPMGILVGHIIWWRGDVMSSWVKKIEDLFGFQETNLRSSHHVVFMIRVWSGWVSWLIKWISWGVSARLLYDGRMLSWERGLTNVSVRLTSFCGSDVGGYDWEIE